MNTSTPKEIIFIVVGTLALLSVIGLCSLAGTLFYKAYADPAVLTAFISITSACIGSLGTLLVNTRQPPTSNGQVSSKESATVTVEPKPDEPKT